MFALSNTMFALSNTMFALSHTVFALANTMSGLAGAVQGQAGTQSPLCPRPSAPALSGLLFGTLEGSAGANAPSTHRFSRQIAVSRLDDLERERGVQTHASVSWTSVQEARHA